MSGSQGPSHMMADLMESLLGEGVSGRCAELEESTRLSFFSFGLESPVYGGITGVSKEKQPSRRMVSARPRNRTWN